jgi:hypothetical protein
MTRDEKGRFIKGHEKTGGRKSRAYEDAVMELFKKVVTPDKQRKIIEKAVDLAAHGDQAARKFIFDYLIGPPVQRSEVSGNDGEPMIIKVIYDKK